MTHIGLAIDPETRDLFFKGNELAIVTGAEAVGQHARQRVMTFRGEWFLDTTAGVPWLAQIMGAKYDPALSEAVVKAEILDTDGVVEITSFAVGFDRTVRRLNIRDVEVLSIYDQEVAL